MRSCEPVSVEGDVVVLEFVHNFHRSKVEEEHNKQAVEEALSGIVGQRYRIRCVLAHQEPAATPPVRATPKPTSPTEQIMAEDPVVRAAVEDLGAQIVQRQG